MTPYHGHTWALLALCISANDLNRYNDGSMQTLLVNYSCSFLYHYWDFYSNTGSETKILTLRINVHHDWWNSVVEHCGDVIMNTMESQITSLTIVYSTIHSRRRSKKQQSSALLAFVLTGEFPAQRASNAENVSIWLRHHVHFHRIHIYIWYKSLYTKHWFIEMRLSWFNMHNIIQWISMHFV